MRKDNLTREENQEEEVEDWRERKDDKSAVRKKRRKQIGVREKTFVTERKKRVRAGET